jgi:hypothetical protein
MKLPARFHNGVMNHRPMQSPEHADYRTRVIEADRAAERLLQGLRKNEPWAIRLAAHFERVTGTTRPVCYCDECAQRDGSEEGTPGASGPSQNDGDDRVHSRRADPRANLPEGQEGGRAPGPIETTQSDGTDA